MVMMTVLISWKIVESWENAARIDLAMDVISVQIGKIILMLITYVSGSSHRPDDQWKASSF
jgi:hypothetical protein